jgi:FAD/FMN-containing dehydrogenase
MTRILADRPELHEALRAALTGRVVTAEDPDYDDARRVWNADIDRRPAVIAYCTDLADVVAALACARTAGWEISVRCGGHATAGTSVGDDGIVIDLSRMNTVTVDPEHRRAVVGGGALLRDLDAATQAHGLAVPAGEIGHTGVGGLTLGGGMGWLTRQYGLTIDNLLAAQVVLADGRIVRAAPDEHPDLFWAIRGGGGNFGIVTQFEFALHPVGPLVQLGVLFYGMDQSADALRLARDTIADLPADVSFQIVAMYAPPAPFVPAEHHSRLGFALIAVGTGGEDTHAAVLARMRAACTPLFESVTPVPYTALQQTFDETYAWGAHCYDKATYLAELTDPVIDVIVEHVARMDSPTSVAQFYVLSGAYCTPADDDTAFSGGRSPRLCTFLIGFTPDPAALPAERAWVRGFFEALAPHALSRGAYVNGLYDGDDAHRVPDSYGTKYARLTALKTVYDPQNLFHRNGNIRPDPTA